MTTETIGTGSTLGMALRNLFAVMTAAGPARDRTRYEITGRLTQGSDSRVRGQGRNSPLRIAGAAGDWDRINAELAADADPARLEELFIEDVVTEDLGEGSHPWEFDGDWYEVRAA